MMDLLSNPAILALIGTIFGGAGLKIIEHWLSKAKTRDDTATQIRNELRTELSRLKDDLDKSQKKENAAEQESDTWRTKYYVLLEEFIKLKGELSEALKLITKSADKATGKLKESGLDTDPDEE